MAGEDPRHTAWIREQGCCAPGAYRSGFAFEVSGCQCMGVMAPHHQTGAGKGLRAHDHETMPLCARHHSDFHDGRGVFRGWDKAKRRAWQREMVEKYRPKEDS